MLSALTALISVLFFQIKTAAIQLNRCRSLYLLTALIR